MRAHPSSMRARISSAAAVRILGATARASRSPVRRRFDHESVQSALLRFDLYYDTNYSNTEDLGIMEEGRLASNRRARDVLAQTGPRTRRMMFTCPAPAGIVALKCPAVHGLARCAC
jgi:hypothetical protein